jgi:hypothetical protein
MHAQIEHATYAGMHAGATFSRYTELPLYESVGAAKAVLIECSTFKPSIIVAASCRSVEF